MPTTAARKAQRRNLARRKAARGFSLVELAIAMFIFALVLSSILAPAADLYERRKNDDAREYLERTAQAVINYAVRNRTVRREITYGSANAVIPAGRPYLPCPDVDGDGIEDRVAITDPVTIGTATKEDGTCLFPKGTVPWRTLQLPQDLDPWGNRLTYHADFAFSNALFGFDETTRADVHDTTQVLGGTPRRFLTRGNKEQTFIICGYPPAGTAFCSEIDPNGFLAGVVNTSGGDITTAVRRYQSSGSFNTDTIQGAAFVLLSHGKNGRYARNSNDTCNGGRGSAIPSTTAPNLAVNPGAHEYRNGYLACHPTGTPPTNITGDEAQSNYFSYPRTEVAATGEFDDLLRWAMAEELFGAINDTDSARQFESTGASPLPIPNLLFLPPTGLSYTP